MSVTDFGALTAAQKRVWSGKLWKQFRDQSFWMSNGFVAGSMEDDNTPVSRITDLSETSAGLECVMQLVHDLEGDGIAGDNKLEDNEEAMNNDSQTIKIDMLRHGVKSKGYFSSAA